MSESQRVHPVWEVGVVDVSRRLKEDAASMALVDCREADECAIAMIEGALHIPLGDIPSRLSEIEALEDEGREVIVYCHSGVRSMHAAVFLRKEGVESARSMAGGIDAWSLLVDQDVPRY